VRASARSRGGFAFLFFTFLYLLTYKGVSAGDDLYHLVTAQTWLRTAALHLPDVPFAAALPPAFLASLLVGLCIIVWPYATY
jgi:hypothetical protein